MERARVASTIVIMIDVHFSFDTPDRNPMLQMTLQGDKSTDH